MLQISSAARRSRSSVPERMRESTADRQLFGAPAHYHFKPLGVDPFGCHKRADIEHGAARVSAGRRSSCKSTRTSHCAIWKLVLPINFRRAPESFSVCMSPLYFSGVQPAFPMLFQHACEYQDYVERRSTPTSARVLGSASNADSVSTHAGAVFVSVSAFTARLRQVEHGEYSYT